MRPTSSISASRTSLEFAGTESALQLAGDMVCAHGRLGIGGYHNDGPRTIDYGLWNFKALTAVNCHERRIMWEVDLSQRCLTMLSARPLDVHRARLPCLRHGRVRQG